MSNDYAEKIKKLLHLIKLLKMQFFKDIFKGKNDNYLI